MKDENRIFIQAGGGLVENELREVLFIFRRGKWDLPKGKLDRGETLEQCAIREVEEETGVRQLNLVRFLLITEHEYVERGKKILKGNALVADENRRKPKTYSSNGRRYYRDKMDRF